MEPKVLITGRRTGKIRLMAERITEVSGMAEDLAGRMLRAGWTFAVYEDGEMRWTNRKDERA